MLERKYAKAEVKRLFEAKPPRAFSITDLSTEVGVSSGAINNHVKQMLFDEKVVFLGTYNRSKLYAHLSHKTVTIPDHHLSEGVEAEVEVSKFKKQVRSISVDNNIKATLKLLEKKGKRGITHFELSKELDGGMAEIARTLTAMRGQVGSRKGKLVLQKHAEDQD